MGQFKRGDLVTVMPPYEGDPLILSFQHYGRVAEVQDDGEYTVTLGAVWPPEMEFGPFPEDRLKSGWRSPAGIWWVKT